MLNKIRNKIILLTFGAVILSLSAVSAYFLIELNAVTKQNTAELEQTLREDYDRHIKNQVENVLSLLTVIYQDYKTGKYELEEAKKTAADIIRELRYGEAGYFWIDTREGYNVVLLGRDSEGTNRYELQDKKGNYLIKEIIKAALNGGGYTNYWFPKKEGGEALLKRSYSAYFEPFDWVIGTGNYIDDIDIIVEQKKQTSEARSQDIMYSVLLGSFVILILVSIPAYFTGVRISRPITELSKGIEPVAQGNLNIELKIHTKDEVGKLQQSLNILISKFKEIVSHLKESSAFIASAADDFSSNSQKLSQMTSEQASSLEEISASMEQIAAGAEQNRENAEITETYTQGVEKDMQNSNESTKKTVAAMEEIIENISFINDIAGKTDLLAINASIESARAGEHGKGFGVVASEIRKLAEKSSRAVEIIETLSSQGIEVSHSTLTEMHKSLKRTEKTHELVRNISRSGREINNGVDQVNVALTEMNSITTQNAETAEKMAGSSEELSAQASRLDELMNFFKT